ncbi:hypothetical protein ACRCPS_31090 [Pseudomonas aeruginosa]
MDDLLPPSLAHLMRAITSGELGVICLPEEMLDEEADAAWMAILGGRNRIKELADKFRKLKVETGMPRKHLRVLPDAVLLGCCYSTPSMTDQLEKQLPPQQIEALIPYALANRFLPELLGDFMPELEETMALGSNAQIKERILDLLPEAESAFSLAWGPTIYRPLMILGYLLEIGPDLEPGTTEYYQACFALMAVLYELIDTQIIEETRKSQIEIEGYGQVYHGMMAVRLSYSVNKTGGAAVHSPYSLAVALYELSYAVQDLGPMAGIRMLELLHNLFQPDHQGLKRIAEEYVSTGVNAFLVFMTSLLEKAVKEAEMDDGSVRIPEPLEEWILQPAKGVVTTDHFKLLQPLMGQEVTQVMRSGEQLKKQISEQASLVSKHRQAVRAATTGGTLDPAKITSAAETLNQSTAQMTALVNETVASIQSILDTCSKVRQEWDKLAVHSAASLPEAIHLSASASTEDRDILALALEESQLLRGQLQESQALNHTLQLKIDATSFHQEQSYQGPAASPALLRKVVTSPDALTPEEVLAYIQFVGDGKVLVLPSAWRSADESEAFEYSGRMLELLDKLVFHYAPALASGKPDAEARDILGASYSARESDTVVLNQDMRSERTFLVNGTPRYFGRHLSVGNDPSAARGMRIYFDIIDGVINIAYCGKHLTVTSSN